MNKKIKNIMQANRELYTKDLNKIAELYAEFNLPFRFKYTGEYYRPVKVVARQQQHELTSKFYSMTILYQPLIYKNVQIVGYKDVDIKFISNDYENILDVEFKEKLKQEKMICGHCNKRFSKNFMFITFDSSTGKFNFLSNTCFEEEYNVPYTKYRGLIAQTSYFFETNYDMFQGLKTKKVVHHVPYKIMLDRAVNKVITGNQLSEKQFSNLQYSDNIPIEVSRFNDFQNNLSNLDEETRKPFENLNEHSYIPYTLIPRLYSIFNRYMGNSNSLKEPITMNKKHSFKDVTVKDIKDVKNQKKPLYLYTLDDNGEEYKYFSEKKLDLEVGQIIDFDATPYKESLFRGIKSILVKRFKIK